jgi:hypothetical protein
MANTMTDDEPLDDKVNQPSNEQDEYDPRNPNPEGFFTRAYNAGKELWDDTKAFASSIQASTDGSEYRPSRAGLTSAIGAAVVGGALVGLPACDGGPGVEPKPPTDTTDTTDTTSEVDSVEATAKLQLFSSAKGTEAPYVPVRFTAGALYEAKDTTNRNGVVTFNYKAPKNFNQTLSFEGGDESDSSRVQPFSHEYFFEENLDEKNSVRDHLLGQREILVLLQDNNRNGVKSTYQLTDAVTGREIQSGTGSSINLQYEDRSLIDSLRVTATPTDTTLDGRIDTTAAKSFFDEGPNFSGVALKYDF